MDIRVPNKPPGSLDKGPHPWERAEYVRPEPDELEAVDADLALEGYTALRRDIAWLRAEVKEALTAGNAMRLRELLELFVWGQDLRRVYQGAMYEAPEPPSPPPPARPPPPPVVKSAARDDYRLNKRVRHRDSDWEL